MANKRLRCLRKVNMFKFNVKRKIKSPFMIYTDFENILVPEDDGKQNLN